LKKLNSIIPLPGGLRALEKRGRFMQI